MINIFNHLSNFYTKKDYNVIRLNKEIMTIKSLKVNVLRFSFIIVEGRLYYFWKVYTLGIIHGANNDIMIEYLVIRLLRENIDVDEI